MVTIKNIAWAAGIYEGEGTFSGGHSVRVVQKDSWLTYELQRLFGGSVNQSNGYHYWTIAGPKARGFLLTIFSFLSPRRKTQILEYPLFFKDPSFLPADFCSNGHEYTPENTFMETVNRGKENERSWRTCKICRKAKYDRKNNLTPEEKSIKAIARARGISSEEAKKIFEEIIH